MEASRYMFLAQLVGGDISIRLKHEYLGPISSATYMLQ